MVRLLLLAVALFLTGLAFGQDRTISGKILSDEDQSALPGVNIVVEGTIRGTITDIDGNYKLQLEPEDRFLVFSYIGFVSQSIEVGAQTVIDVQLAEEATELSELIITGYSTQEKRNVVGAISSITPESYKDIAIAGMDQALQGQAPGVMVTQSSGTPGGGIMIRVRGNASISSSNRPLFIVDGVPVRDGGLTGRGFGGQSDNALAALNPNDIASIEVLKDASAKAIYGSRGANGVILVTTKRGKAGTRTQFDLDVQRGMVDLTREIELLGSSQLLELQREALENAEDDPDNAGRPGITDGVNTNWIDQITRTGILQQYQLSARGGTEKTRFYLSGAYRGEEGVMLNNKFDRFTTTMNFDHSATQKLDLGINLILARTLNKRVKNDNFLDGVYSGAVRSLPFFQPYDERGQLFVPGDPGYPSFPNFNPVGQAIEPRFDTHTTKITGGVYVQYKFLEDLNFRTNLSIDYNTVQEDQFEPTTTAIGGFLVSVGQQGLGVFGTSETASIISTSILNYRRTVGTDHVFGGLLGFELIKNSSLSSSVQGILFPSDEFTYIASAGLVTDGSSFTIESGLMSFLSEVNYRYKDKYLATFNARYDGSSRFGPDNRFGFFPAISIGWRMSEEAFMQDISIIDGLKWRISLGKTGNERIGSFQFLGTFASATAYNGVAAVAPATLANPNLKWEETTEFNAGVDVSLFEGRIQTSVDYYNNITTDLLLAASLPTTTGFSSVQGNLGEVHNQGLEFMISSVNIDREIRWTTNFNISGNRNKVVALATDESQFAGYQTFTNSTHIITPGQPLGTFYGLRFLGVDPGNGDAIYEDINNDGRITADDGMVLANAQPDFIGGFTNVVSYMGFQVSLFLQYSYGNNMINFGNTTLLNSGENLENNQVVKALERWSQPGDITEVPRYELGNTFNNRFSDRFIEDASYLRIKNLSISYNLPPQIVSRYNLGSARVYATGTNLWTWTDYTGGDPEINSLDGSTVAQGLDLDTFPQVRTLLIGVTLGF